MDAFHRYHVDPVLLSPSAPSNASGDMHQTSDAFLGLNHCPAIVFHLFIYCSLVFALDIR